MRRVHLFNPKVLSHEVLPNPSRAPLQLLKTVSIARFFRIGFSLLTRRYINKAIPAQVSSGSADRLRNCVAPRVHSSFYIFRVIEERRTALSVETSPVEPSVKLQSASPEGKQREAA